MTITIHLTVGSCISSFCSVNSSNRGATCSRDGVKFPLPFVSQTSLNLVTWIHVIDWLKLPKHNKFSDKQFLKCTFFSCLKKEPLKINCALRDVFSQSPKFQIVFLQKIKFQKICDWNCKDNFNRYKSSLVRFYLIILKEIS